MTDALTWKFAAAFFAVSLVGGVAVAQPPNGDRGGASTGVDEPALLPREGVLVLRAGQVLRGTITHAGDLYYVILPQGEIRIQAAQVAMVCDSIEEAYRRKRSLIRLGNVQDHLELAQWCQQQRLFSAAAAELSDALAADPDNPRVAYLERRLQMAMTSVETVPAESIEARQGPSVEQLDEMVRSLPADTVTRFTTTIQPLLLNSCAAAECHSSRAESEYRLMRLQPGRPPTRRVTQRNLHATLAWIDREQPDASRLLSTASQPHGTATGPSLAEDNATAYRQLVAWVHQVADHAPEPKMSPTDEATGTPPGSDQPTDLVADEQPEMQSPPSNVQRGAIVERFVPVDPFDPEIFNRRFAPEP